MYNTYNGVYSGVVCEDSLGTRKCERQQSKGNCELDHIKLLCAKTCGSCNEGIESLFLICCIFVKK